MKKPIKCVKELKSEKFTKVNPSEYAEKLRDEFSKDKSLWNQVIAPREMVEVLYHRVNGDYSQLWEERCALCFCEINKDTAEDCYVSEDRLTWLCNQCSRKLFSH